MLVARVKLWPITRQCVTSAKDSGYTNILQDKKLFCAFEAGDIVCWLVNLPIAKLDLFKSLDCRWIGKSYTEYCYRNSATVRRLYPDTGDQCSQLIVATLVPSTPLCLFFNLAKLQCKQTVVTDFCIGFVNKIHIIGKGKIKETWIAKIKDRDCHIFAHWGRSLCSKKCAQLVFSRFWLQNWRVLIFEKSCQFFDTLSFNL